MIALSYFPTGEKHPLAGTHCAWWQTYGIPWIWDSAAAMQSYLHCTRLDRCLEFNPISERVAYELSAQMVEVLSGRRRVQGSLRPVVDVSRPTYEQVMHALSTGNFRRMHRQ